ncbi:hypothetical protein [Streptomyces chartreusis]|uniref:hypothetical protein n=1 Tax=Streptomyces chartreusis TaxID=1969 RepID=UPI00367A0F3D
MHTHPAIPLADSHPVAEPVRDLIDAIVVAARAGDDTAIRALLTRLAPVADTITLLLLRYRLGLREQQMNASASHDGTV